MLSYPHFDPVAFWIPLEFTLPWGTHFGPLAVRWYGITYLVGFVGAWMLARRRALRSDSPVMPMQVDDLIFYAACGVILGGRIGYMLFYGFDQILDNPLNLLRIWEGGMSFHGGFLGVLVALWLVCRKAQTSTLRRDRFHRAARPLRSGRRQARQFHQRRTLGQRPTDVPWGMVFPHVDAAPRHASQLYQFALEGLLLFGLVWWFAAGPGRARSVWRCSCVGYGLQRFFVEFYREPDCAIGYLALGWLTMGQALSLPMMHRRDRGC
jgi:phosphatidylglycerol:prolipoprotein diacylglycerol transferase